MLINYINTDNIVSTQHYLTFQQNLNWYHHLIWPVNQQSQHTITQISATQACRPQQYVTHLHSAFNSQVLWISIHNVNVAHF